MMRVLFDVTHPAHVHLFKHAIESLDRGGHTIRVTSREKDVTTDLLDAYGIPHTPISTQGRGRRGLLSEWALRELRTIRVAMDFSPDVVVSRLNPTAAHAATLAGSSSVIFDDTEQAGTIARLTHPFASVVCTPANFGRSAGAKERRYAGMHELAYLHPNWFEPDPSVLAAHGVDAHEPYAVVRLVSMDAHHDHGVQGLTGPLRRDLVSTLTDHGALYITSEAPLPPDLEPYRLPVPPEAIHHLLAFSDLYVGDSGTMVTEAAILGTPAVRLDTFGTETGNFSELESQYGLIRHVPRADLVRTVEDLLATDDLAEIWATRCNAFLAEKIDVTAFMLDVIRQEAAG